MRKNERPVQTCDDSGHYVRVCTGWLLGALQQREGRPRKSNARAQVPSIFVRLRT